MSETKHIGCGGELTFSRNIGKRSLYACSKCRQQVNVITGKSYNEYVRDGQIKPKVVQ